MTQSDEDGRETPLNPALTRRSETSYDLSATPAPVETASATAGEGEGWPWVWVLVVAVGVLLALYFIL